MPSTQEHPLPLRKVTQLRCRRLLQDIPIPPRDLEACRRHVVEDQHVAGALRVAAPVVEAAIGIAGKH